MKLDKFSGRLFMTIAVSTTFCACAILLLFFGGLEAETKIAVFAGVSTLTGSIAKDYFNRTDRDDKKSNSPTSGE